MLKKMLKKEDLNKVPGVTINEVSEEETVELVEPIVFLNEKGEITIDEVNTFYTGIESHIYSDDIISKRISNNQYMNFNLANQLFLNRARFAINNTLLNFVDGITKYVKDNLMQMEGLEENECFLYENIQSRLLDNIFPNFEQFLDIRRIAPTSPNCEYRSMIQISDLAVYLVSCVQELLVEKLIRVYIGTKYENQANILIQQGLYETHPIVIGVLIQQIAQLRDFANSLYTLSEVH